MSAATSAGAATSRDSLRRALPFAAVIAGIVLVGLVGGGGRTGGEPLDPRSTEPLGARGLVLLLERFGAEVRLAEGTPPAGATAVLLRDELNEEETERLEQWVEAGGTLVVADPRSSLAPALASDAGGGLDLDTGSAEGEEGEDGGRRLRPRCPLPALQQVQTIEVQRPAGYRVPGDAIGCFPVGEGAFLVARPSGAGTVVALAGGGPLVNEQLDEADNAVLAVSLMAPAGGVVTFVEPSLLGGGQRGLTDLVSPRVKNGLWQLLIAFGLFALWRARRLGRPVEEQQPVQIASAELVSAVGNLLQQARRRDAAARMLRVSLRRSLSERLGVPPDAPVEVFAAAATTGAGIDAGRVSATLEDRPPADDAALVGLARSVESIRREVTHAR